MQRTTTMMIPDDDDDDDDNDALDGEDEGEMQKRRAKHRGNKTEE